MEANWNRIEYLVVWRLQLQRIINYRLEVVPNDVMEYVMGWAAIVHLLELFSRFSTAELVARKVKVEEELDFMLDRVCYHY